MYCENFDTEMAAAAAYDRAIRHFRPQDAELYVNFKQGLPMSLQNPMTGPVYQNYWEAGDGADDGQVRPPCTHAYTPACLLLVILCLWHRCSSVLALSTVPTHVLCRT